MLFSNVQDDAILSERNEQDMFQSESSNESEDENDRIAQDEEDDLQPKESQTPSFSEQQIIKEETKKKDIIKDTCLEKIKGYIGFGRSELILNEKIGSIFLLPISSNWTFKLQVTITQVIIAVTCFTLFIGIQFIGQNVLFNTVQLWTQKNISYLLKIQLFEATMEFLQLIINTQQNENQLINISLDLLLIKNISYKGQLYNMVDELPNSTREYISDIGIIDSYTFDFATYTILNNKNIEEQKIRNYLSLNSIIKYNYQTFASMYFWVFDDGFTMQYPGINVTNLEIFKQYRYEMYHKMKNLENYTSEILYDFTLKQLLQRVTKKIFNENQQQIGLVFCERQPFILYLLYYQTMNNTMQNFTIFILNNENEIIYVVDQEYQINKAELQILLYSLNTTNQQLHIINKEETLKHLYQENTYYFDQDLSNYFDIYYGEINGDPFLFSYIKFDGLYIGIFQPAYYYINLIESEKGIFNNQIDTLNRKLIPLALAIPFIYIILCVFYMIQQIKPLQKVTEFADQLLKKSQNFDEKQVEEFDGNGLIQQLASLFKKLMINLNKSKQIKKQEIIEFYNKQTYPKNQNLRDVTDILREIDKININKLDKGVLEFPNLDD